MVPNASLALTSSHLIRLSIVSKRFSTPSIRSCSASLSFSISERGTEIIDPLHDISVPGFGRSLSRLFRIHERVLLLLDAGEGDQGARFGVSVGALLVTGRHGKGISRGSSAAEKVFTEAGRDGWWHALGDAFSDEVVHLARDQRPTDAAGLLVGHGG
ncbi:hypothetical protein [Methylobacterium sp. P5_C11]